MEGGAEMVSTVAGRYRLDRLLAVGGMAEVWRAHDLFLDRPVALKMPLRHLRERAEFIERFRREAVAAARLNHPRVVGVYDTGRDADLGGYIVMELVEGPSLRELIEESGPLTVERAVTLAAEVAGALDFAHRRGIVHCDIKPANVLVASEGAKVADFGIAKASLRGEDLTETSVTLGTARYLSPEQVEGRPLDARTDVYSLGIVLYEMLCGCAPFEAETELALALKHVTTEPQPASATNPAVPAWLDEVVMRALAKAPDDRFASAGEFRLALLNKRPLDRPSQWSGLAGGAAADSAVRGRMDGEASSWRPGRAGTMAPVLSPADLDCLGRDPTSALAIDRSAFSGAGSKAWPNTESPGGGASERRDPIEFDRAPRRSRGGLLAVLAMLAVLVALVAAGVGVASVRLGHRVPRPRLGSPITAPALNSVQLPVSSAHSFNPAPGSGSEHEEAVGKLIDGNPATYWYTEHYANANFGNLKGGVGAYLQLRTPGPVGHLVISSPDQGWRFQIYEGGAPSTTLAGWGPPVAQGSITAPTTSVDLGGHRAGYVLLWITRLDSADWVRVGEIALFS